MKKSVSTITALASGLIAIAPFAVAQDAAQEAEDSVSTLGTITVTTQRREQTLLEVPVAVSVVSGETLENALFTTLDDIQRLAPSVTVTNSTSPYGGAIRIRGVGTNVFSVTVEPSVSVVIDGIALPRNDAGLVELADIERVEVLKGPQGTLFGKNASAGVISYTTKAPSSEFEGLVKARATTDGDYRLDATVSDAIGDKAGFRLTGFYNEGSDFYDNVFTGNEIGGQRSFGGRGKLVFEPADNFSIELSADYYDLEADCCAIPLREVSGGNLLELTGITPSETNTTVSLDSDPFNTTEQWGVAAELSWDLGSINLTSLTGYRDWETGGDLNDFDFFGGVGMNAPTIGGITLGQQAYQEAQTTSQEFRITPLNPEKIDYVVGLYYYNNDLGRFFDRDVGLCFAPAAPIGGACAAGLELDAFFQLDVDTTNISLYGDATVDINDKLSLIVGARALYDELEFFTDTSNGFVGGDKLDDTDIIGRLGFLYELNDQLSTFFTYSRGYKSGAYDATIAINDAVLSGGPVDPETSDAFEFGIRGNPFPEADFFVDFSIFHNSYQDFHVQAFDPDNPGGTRLLNAGETVTAGAELAVNWAPNENWTLNGTAQYLDAKFEDFQGAGCFPGQTAAQGCITDGFGRNSQSLDGKTLQNAPEWKFSFAPRYEKELGNGGRIFGQGVASYQGEVQYSLNQNPNTTQDAYTLVDLTAGYVAPNDQFTFTLFAKNAFDEFYVGSIGGVFINGPGLTQIVPRNAERIVGAELALNF